MATSKGGYVSGGFDILKAPNAPTITSVTTGIGSATVAFTAPADVGGGAITSYTITAVDESTGASTGAVGSASPITISPGGGTFKIRAAATNIYGPGRVSQYSTGNGIYSGASLWAWSSNTDGQLGDGTRANKSSPVQIGALSTWTSASTSSFHSLGVTSDGKMFAWGSNDSWGALGLNLAPSTASNRSSPVQVGALTNWSTVATGVAPPGTRPSSFAIKTDGTLWSWGNNTYGQLGINNVDPRSSPVQIGAATDWASVASNGGSTFAIKSTGSLWAWGNNDQGQLGQNNSSVSFNRSSPVQVGSLTNWATVSAGDRFALSVKTDGTLWSWGYGRDGCTGHGNTVAKSSPVQVGALSDWSRAVSGVSSFTATALKTNGTLWGWGKNNYGQIGTNNTIYRSSPVQVGALTNWRKVGLCSAIKSDGTMWKWGRNVVGTVGDGTTTNRSSPVQIGALTNWYEIFPSSDQSTTLALYGVV